MRAPDLNSGRDEPRLQFRVLAMHPKAYVYVIVDGEGVPGRYGGELLDAADAELRPTGRRTFATSAEALTWFNMIALTEID